MPIVEFKCKHCFRSFKTRKDTIACEKTHLKVKSAKAKKYMLSPYPLTIDVAFPDGSVEVYIREVDTFSYYRKE